MAAIVVFVECPKSIASEVLVVLRPYQKVEPYRQAVFKISRSQAIVDGRTGPFQSFDIRIKNIGIYTIAHLFSLAKMAQVDEVPLFVWIIILTHRRYCLPSFIEICLKVFQRRSWKVKVNWNFKWHLGFSIKVLEIKDGLVSLGMIPLSCFRLQQLLFYSKIKL